jgi:hypothetical protein
MAIPMPGQPGGSGGTKYQQELKVIMSNLNKEISNIQNASMKGLINAAIYIRNETEKTPPLTPVDLGNLRSSWFITTATKKEANDQWNKGFRKSPKGTKRIADKDLASNHSRAVTEAKGTLAGMNTPTRKFMMMGYSANYAGYVHEFVNPSISWSRAGSNAKWFQSHVYANKTKIFQIVAETSKMKK